MSESIDLIQAMILGFVQGATEFVPVSSSGHLVLVPWLLGWPAPSLLFDTLLHWGTLVAVLIVFWREFLAMASAWVQSIVRRSLADPDARTAWFIVVGTVPAVAAGLFLDDLLESFFLNPLAVGCFLLVTALLLWLSEQLVLRSGGGRVLAQMQWLDAAAIGVAQALALLPGVSRSGSTIAAGLARGIRRDQAARFSFLLGTPAILGAGVLQLVKVSGEDASALTQQAAPILVGFVVAAVTGVVAIRVLLSYLRNHTLYVFSGYCLVVGAATIVWYLVR
ncbi:MAG: undecaprenyl-diphosphatase UppP [Caldilinea sp.]|jgi:undecaprenyl-diphosphatase